ncbi:hypothetical protein HYW99_01220 [Candidatus Woesearchaeota archaeon]|nr:hypothetical protein [Candidatus Woesearchaeota archaeon]
MNKKGASFIFEHLIGIILVVVVAVFIIWAFGPNLKSLIKTSIGISEIETSENINHEKDESWQKILEEYEKNKCRVNKYTCKAENLPCQCFTSGYRKYKEEPETCVNQEPYCYDGEIGCDKNGPDSPTYLEYCQKTNIGFRLMEIPDCKIDNKCKAINMPCKCQVANKQYEICLPDGDSYCYQDNYGCYKYPC